MYNNKLAYKIVTIDGNPCVYVSAWGQYLDRVQLAQELHETRDEKPDVYAQLVHLFIVLDRHSPTEKQK